MSALLLLIPLGLFLGGIFLWIFLWCLKKGQYEDMEMGGWLPMLEKETLSPLEKPSSSSPVQEP